MTKISKAASKKGRELAEREALSVGTTVVYQHHVEVALARYIQQTSDVARKMRGTLDEGRLNTLLASLILPDDEPTPEEVLRDASATAWPRDRLKDCEAKSLAAALTAAGYTIIKREG